MTFRFLHLADVHLDTPFASRERALRRDLTAAGRQAFTHAVDLVLEQQLHALLLAGDLLDDDNLALDTERFLVGQLQRLAEAGVTTVCVTGNHDPGGAASRMKRVQWPKGFYLIDGHHPRTIPIHDPRDGGLVGHVTGAGHTQKHDPTNLAASLPRVPDSADVPHVALVHAMVEDADGEGHDRYAPCTRTDFVGKGYVYWALGHIHKRQQVSDDPVAWYAGNPQGRNPKETGEKGALVVEADRHGAEAAFVRLGDIRWETVVMDDLAEVGDEAAFQQAAVRAGGPLAGADAIVRLVPQGPCPLAADLLVMLADEDRAARWEEDLAAALGVRAVQLRPGRLARPVDIEALYARGIGPFSEALDLLRSLAEDDDPLLHIAPRTLAGLGAERLGGLSEAEVRQARLTYLRQQLPGLDTELAARFVGEGAGAEGGAAAGRGRAVGGRARAAARGGDAT